MKKIKIKEMVKNIKKILKNPSKGVIFTRKENGVKIIYPDKKDDL